MINIADRLYDQKMKTNLLPVIYAVYVHVNWSALQMGLSVYCMPHSSVARKEKLPYDASAHAHVGKGTGRMFDQIKTHCTLLIFLISLAVNIPSSQHQYA